ncbi:hypothetical protein E4U54_002470 [Claviceps lovelessii]|nr:hypothetical protein E4U54_002470 [Claviceps lovelessii]
MAGLEGLEPKPLLANGGWHLTSKSLDQANSDSNRLTTERRDLSEERPSDAVRSKKAIDSSTDHPSRKVITGLPRSQTFTRKLSEQRKHLEPIEATTNERRTASMEQKYTKASNVLGTTDAETAPEAVSSNSSLLSADHGSNSNSSHDLLRERGDDDPSNNNMNSATLDTTSQYADTPPKDACSTLDTGSMTASQYDAMIADELERKWILNLSMHYRDRSRREKFFVTYRKKDQVWKRVTISLDYRDPPPDSLEMELSRMKYQREKSAKIYEAIRESLSEIAFYDTVTNLKLQTTDGRLHVHVVEDGNEIINYPLVDQIRHSSCRRIREKEIHFDCHMSGFVYKVRVHGRTLIKKEIPSPDTVDEFLYEVNALSNLRYSRHVVQLYGVVVDDHDEHVKGLLISYAEQGALIDIIYDNCKEENLGIPWNKREKWARQIIHGLADIHESGFVQGDFTLSNIVVDARGDAKIIDINRRGCPVGWEPPESKTLAVTHHRINMYIGVKSDLYQLGMVLWGLAMLEDEPELQPRPLILRREILVPDWFRDVTDVCLSTDPRMRLNASSLLRMFPPDSAPQTGSIPLLDDEAHALDGHGSYAATMRQPNIIRTVVPSSGCPCSIRTYLDPSPDMYEPYYPMRGRSPPSPLPSQPDGYESPDKSYSSTSWAANKSVRPSYSDIADDDSILPGEEDTVGTALRSETPSSLGKHDVDSAAYLPADIGLKYVSSRQAEVLSHSLGDGLRMLSTPKLARNDMDYFDSLAPNPEIEHHGAPPGKEDSSRVVSRTVRGRSNDSIERRYSSVRGIQAADGDLDGGVSLQPDTGLSGLGISQPFSYHGALGLQREDDSGKYRSQKPNMSMQYSETGQPNGHEAGKHATWTKKKLSTGVGESTTTSDHLEVDRQASPKSRANGEIKDPRRRGESFARQQSLPISLADTGASLQLEYDSKMRHGEDAKDEISGLARPATVQAFMVTTESQR